MEEQTGNLCPRQKAFRREKGFTERERERERERETAMHTNKETQTETHTNRHTNRKTHTPKQILVHASLYSVYYVGPEFLNYLRWSRFFYFSVGPDFPYNLEN